MTCSPKIFKEPITRGAHPGTHVVLGGRYPLVRRQRRIGVWAWRRKRRVSPFPLPVVDNEESFAVVNVECRLDAEFIVEIIRHDGVGGAGVADGYVDIGHLEETVRLPCTASGSVLGTQSASLYAHTRSAGDRGLLEGERLVAETGRARDLDVRSGDCPY